MIRWAWFLSSFSCRNGLLTFKWLNQEPEVGKRQSGREPRCLELCGRPPLGEWWPATGGRQNKSVSGVLVGSYYITLCSVTGCPRRDDAIIFPQETYSWIEDIRLLRLETVKWLMFKESSGMHRKFPRGEELKLNLGQRENWVNPEANKNRGFQPGIIWSKEERAGPLHLEKRLQVKSESSASVRPRNLRSVKWKHCIDKIWRDIWVNVWHSGSRAWPMRTCDAKVSTV